MAFGTLTRFDTLATAFNTTVAQFGEDAAWQAIQEALDAHNQQMSESMTDLVETSTDRLRRYGGPDNMSMEELDEFGTPDAQKISAGDTMGFPLRFYGIALQWTRLYFQNAMANELAAQVVAAQDADVKAVQRELKRALFLSTNYAFLDRRVDGVSLPVKRLVNADSAAIPLAPDGTSFDGATHTHYLYSAGVALATGDLDDLTETVIEHFASGEVVIYTNRAQETAVRGLTGFVPYMDARIVGTTTSDQARGRMLDQAQLNNRAIGIYGPAEIWVKPWIPSGYLLCLHRGGQKALVYRERNAGSGTLQTLFDNEIYPLRARALGREFGIGAFNRVGAAVLYIDTGAGSAYVDPTIT